jgi:DNA-binding GntR family transcriptional regulator
MGSEKLCESGKPVALTNALAREIGAPAVADSELPAPLNRLFRTDLKFHRRLVEAARNPTLAALRESLAPRVERTRYIVGTAPTRMAVAMKEHEAILEAVLSRDPRRTASALFDHSIKTRDAVVTALQTRFDQQPTGSAPAPVGPRARSARGVAESPVASYCGGGPGRRVSEPTASRSR